MVPFVPERLSITPFISSSPVAMTRTPTVIAGLIMAACLLGGCQRHESSPSHPLTPVKVTAFTQYPVVTRQPPLPQGIPTGTTDPHGQPVSLKCFTCHSVRESNPHTAQSADLDEFHQGLKIAHGQLTCISCHGEKDGYSSLKLADGRPLAYSESMRLCAQCHGPQYGDYQHGAHGGMTGHWDLTRGGRERNHCLHCHDPHAPQYPQFAPVAGPRDRFPPAVLPGESHE